MTTKEKQENPADVRTYVRERYGKIAEDFSSAKAASCCGPGVSDSSCCGSEATATVISADQLYEMDVSELPDDVAGLSRQAGKRNGTRDWCGHDGNDDREGSRQ